MVDRFKLSYALAGAVMLASAIVVLVDPAAVRRLVGSPRGAVVAADRRRGCRDRDRAGRRVARLLARPPPRRRLRPGRGRVPPRGLEVRRLRERAAASERDERLLDRREHRLRTRADRHDAARAGVRPHRRPVAGAALSRRRGSAPADASVPRQLRPRAGTRTGGRRSRPAGRTRAPPRSDRLPERGLVRADHLRAALGGVHRQLEGARQPSPLADAVGGRGRDSASPARSPIASAGARW